MAVTKIKPVKSTLSKALDYIQNPDKMCIRDSYKGQQSIEKTADILQGEKSNDPGRDK